MAVLAPMPRPRMQHGGRREPPVAEQTPRPRGACRAPGCRRAPCRARRGTAPSADSTPPNVRRRLLPRRLRRRRRPPAGARSRARCAAAAPRAGPPRGGGEAAASARAARRMCQSRMAYVRASTRLTPADSRSHFDSSVLELLPAGLGQRVEAGAPVGLGRAPLGGDPALMLQAVQRRIERALLHAQQFVRDLLDALRDRPAVHRLERDRPQDQQVERALNQVGLVAHVASLVDCQGERRPERRGGSAGASPGRRLRLRRECGR